MSNQQQYDQSQQPVQQPKKSRGCLFGCLLVFGLIVAAVLCGGFGTYYFVNTQIAKYTSETPIELPVVEYTAEDLAALEKRMESFGNAVDAGGDVSEELVLTADDLNALISKNETFKGKVYAKIEDGQLSGDVSAPTDILPFGVGKGRYFNGSATFDASMENDVLVVRLTAAEVNGEPLPAQFIDGMKAENLAKDMYKDPKNRKVLERFEDVRIDGDKIILKLKPAPEKDDEGGEAADESSDDSAPAEVEPEPAGA